MVLYDFLKLFEISCVCDFLKESIRILCFRFKVGGLFLKLKYSLNSCLLAGYKENCFKYCYDLQRFLK